MDARELSRALSNGSGPQLVDVRSPVEFADGHIAGAVNVPVLQLCAHVDAANLDRKRPVVAICLSGHRSIPVVRRLTGAGFDARQLQGGMLAWRRAGLPEGR
jgi:rhodanese-related sulfurtransferase